MSGQTQGQALDLSAVRHGSDVAAESGIPHAQLLVRFAEALVAHDDAELAALRGPITQALGAMETITPVTYSWKVRAGDIMLLSTDGLHGLVDSKSLHEVLTAHQPDDAAQMLVELAKAQGGPDNITAIIARVDSLN